MILVTGAGGNVGKQVVRELLALGTDVRALVRSPDSAAKLKKEIGGGAKMVVGDCADPNSLRPALEGVSSFYLLSPAEGDLTVGAKRSTNA